MSGVQIVRNSSLVKSCSNKKNQVKFKFEGSTIYFPLNLDPTDPSFRITRS